jgi:hypothetical protein
MGWPILRELYREGWVIRRSHPHQAKRHKNLSPPDKIFRHRSILRQPILFASSSSTPAPLQ